MVVLQWATQLEVELAVEQAITCRHWTFLLMVTSMLGSGEFIKG